MIYGLPDKTRSTALTLHKSQSSVLPLSPAPNAPSAAKKSVTCLSLSTPSPVAVVTVRSVINVASVCQSAPTRWPLWPAKRGALNSPFSSLFLMARKPRFLSRTRPAGRFFVSPALPDATPMQILRTPVLTISVAVAAAIALADCNSRHAEQTAAAPTPTPGALFAEDGRYRATTADDQGFGPDAPPEMIETYTKATDKAHSVVARRAHPRRCPTKSR